MKVLIATSTGATRNSMEICHGIGKDQRLDLSVVLPDKVAVEKVYDPTGWLLVEQEQKGEEFLLIPVSLKDPRNPRKGFKWGHLLRVIRETGPEIIHVWEEPLSYRLFQFTWIRTLARSRAKVIFYGFQNVSFRWKWLQRIIWKLTWNHVSGGAMASSEAVENLRRLGFPHGGRLEHIFYGVPTNLFYPMDKRELKKELAINCRFVVGYVGRLVPEKGLDWLLEAVELLSPDVHCLVLGDGPMGAALEKRSSAPGLRDRVHFLGAKTASEVPKWMNCFDVLAVPSLTRVGWKEQYGRVIAEAMACGVPVVGSDSGAIPEVLDSCGLVVPEGNVEKLAEALHSAIHDEETRARLIQGGLRRVKEELSVHVMSQRLVEFYERILFIL